jgi:hypothetical protein
MVSHIEYYKGKVMVSPQNLSHGEFCESLYTRGSFVHQKCSNYVPTKFLFGLCKFIWVIDILVTNLSPHLGVVAHPSYPKNVVS